MSSLPMLLEAGDLLGAELLISSAFHVLLLHACDFGAEVVDFLLEQAFLAALGLMDVSQTRCELRWIFSKMVASTIQTMSLKDVAMSWRQL